MFHYTLMFTLGIAQGIILRDWYVDKQTLSAALKRNANKRGKR